MSVVIAHLDRINREHPWSHNDAYISWVLRQARAVRRSGGRAALDVGCGTGNLVAGLAARMPSVTGIEPHAATSAVASARIASLPNALIRNEDLDDHDGDGYDLITFIASIHHLPLDTTLIRVRSMLRAGGRIVIVGVSREQPADRMLSTISLLVNPVIGIIRHPRRARRLPVHMTAPTARPLETFDEIAATMRTHLPGVRIRRSLFWRYTAAWTAPTI